MKYRTKLYISFIAIVFCTTLIGLFTVYLEMRHIFIQQLQSKVLTVVVTGAKGIDGDLLKQVDGPSSPEFETVTRKMDQILQVNRGSDVYILSIYTLKINPKDPNQLEIGIESTPTSYTYSNTPYPEGLKYGVQNHLNAPWVTPHLYTDRYGTFISGFAPIFDSKGDYVTTIGVDVTSKFVGQDLSKIQWLAFITFLTTLTAGFIAATFLSQLVTRSLNEVSVCVQNIGEGNLKTRLKIHSHDEFGDLASSINTMAKSLEDHERLKLNFIRYVSKHVMEKILTSDISTVIKGERRKVTILYSDIRKFTKLSENLSPEEVVSLLNEYLDKMLNVIFANNGTLDKFIGDGLQVEFGAPLEDTNQEISALKAAIEMQEAIKIFNLKLKLEKRPTLNVGIGIHTGMAVLGNIGSEKRMEYTAVGDTVFIAFQVEDATKQFNTPILISETSIEPLKGRYNLEKVGSIQISGTDKSLDLYTVLL